MNLQALIFTTLAIGSALNIVHADPSSVPYHGYTCPPTDPDGYPVEKTFYAPDFVFCNYPIIPLGPDTLYYACFYSQVSRQSYCKQTFHVNLAAAIQIDGTLEDGGGNGCPPTAIAPMQRRQLAGVARAPLPSRPLVGRGIPAGRSDIKFLKKRGV